MAENFEGTGMYVPLVYRWKDLDEQDLIKFLFGEIWIQNVRDVDFKSDFQDSKKFPKKTRFWKKKSKSRTWQHLGPMAQQATLSIKDEVMEESAPKDPENLEGNVAITSRNVRLKVILNDRKCEPLFWYQLKWIFGGGGGAGV